MSDTAVQSRVQPAKEVRAIYSFLDTPKKWEEAGKEVGEGKYSATYVIPADVMKPVVSTAVAVAKEKWPAREMKELRWPWRIGTKFVDDTVKWAARKAEDKGKALNAAEIEALKEKTIKLLGGDPKAVYVMKASSKFSPQLSALDKGKIVEATEATRPVLAKKFYSGSYHMPEFNFVPFKAKKLEDQDGVTVYLDAVLWVKDGEKIGGQTKSAADRFKGYAGTVTQEDPTQGLEDEIPF